MLPFVVSAVLVLLTDQVTKVAIRAQLAPGDRVDLLPFLELRHVHNRGIAFGILADHAQLVLVGTALIAVVLFASLLRLDDATALTGVGIGLIAGGAVGNLVDRARFGYVTDMLHLPHWPTFNVADVGIVAGVAAVLISQLRAPAVSHATGERPETRDAAGNDARGGPHAG